MTNKTINYNKYLIFICFTKPEVLERGRDYPDGWKLTDTIIPAICGDEYPTEKTVITGAFRSGPGDLNFSTTFRFYYKSKYMSFIKPETMLKGINIADIFEGYEEFKSDEIYPTIDRLDKNSLNDGDIEYDNETLQKHYIRAMLALESKEKLIEKIIKNEQIDEKPIEKESIEVKRPSKYEAIKIGVDSWNVANILNGVKSLRTKEWIEKNIDDIHFKDGSMPILNDDKFIVGTKSTEGFEIPYFANDFIKYHTFLAYQEKYDIL